MHCSASLEDIATFINPTVRGWINYFGAFYKTALRRPLKQIEERLVMWVRRKFKSLRFNVKRARRLIVRIAREPPNLFAHWQFGVHLSAGK